MKFFFTELAQRIFASMAQVFVIIDGVIVVATHHIEPVMFQQNVADQRVQPLCGFGGFLLQRQEGLDGFLFIIQSAFNSRVS